MLWGSVVLRSSERSLGAPVMDIRLHLAGLSTLLALAGSVAPAFAQVYVWKDPETGRTIMSNLRPAWYRSNDSTIQGRARS